MKRSHVVPWYVVPTPLMTSTMLTRPLTLRSKPFALVVVANVPSSVPVVRAGRDSCAWRSGHFATLELRERAK